MGKESQEEKMGWGRVKIDGQLVQEKSASKSHLKFVRQVHKFWRECLVHQN